MAEHFSVMQLANQLQTEADAYLLMERLRWNGQPVCPHCHSERVHFLKPANGVSRKTRTGSNSERRVWFCGECRKQFSVLTDTVFHGTKISLRKWLFVLFEMCSSKNGVAAREIERKYDLTAKSAWFMLHRIREAMKSGPLADMMRGAINADESFFGGKASNRSGKTRRPKESPMVPGSRTFGGKTPVFTLVNKTTGESRSRVVPDITGATLGKIISQNVDMAGSTLMTDTGASYFGVGLEFISHDVVNHRIDEYVRYEGDRVITSNHAENFFSQLKRSVDGTHHHVSAEHLQRYLDEFDFRYSTRKLSDSARMVKLFGQVARKRLTYSVSPVGG